MEIKVSFSSSAEFKTIAVTGLPIGTASSKGKPSSFRIYFSRGKLACPNITFPTSVCGIRTGSSLEHGEKIAVVNSEQRPNAAPTLLTAPKDDWKLPVKRKGVSTPKPSPTHEEGPPEMSDEELAEIREESRAMFDQLRKSLRGRANS